MSASKIRYDNLFLLATSSKCTMSHHDNIMSLKIDYCIALLDFLLAVITLAIKVGVNFEFGGRGVRKITPVTIKRE